MRHSSLFWGGVLILLGILFLLDNLNILSVNVWNVFWPLLLIMLGLKLLWRMAGRRTVTSEQVTLPLKGVEKAHVRVDYGAGELRIHGETAPDELLAGTFGAGLDYAAYENGDTVNLELRPPARTSAWGWPWWQAEDRNWNFGLNNAIPLSLEVNAGASSTRLDLSELQLSRLVIHTGASETNLTLPAHAGHTQAEVETGMASVKIRVPDGVAARMHTKGGMADIKVDQDRFPRRGSRYESPDYETADHKVDLRVSVGMGSVRIE